MENQEAQRAYEHAHALLTSYGMPAHFLDMDYFPQSAWDYYPALSLEQAKEIDSAIKAYRNTLKTISSE